MTLDIRAGMFAVLRDGDVVGPIRATGPSNTGAGWPFCTENRAIWFSADGLVETIDGKPLSPLAATFATRAEALAYVADNPMNRENFPDGPDLASVPQTVLSVDWQARAEALEEVNERLTACLVAAVEGPWNHAVDMPLALQAIQDSAILADAKEPRHE